MDDSELIKAVLEKHDLTCVGLATILDVNERSLRAWRNGDRDTCGVMKGEIRDNLHDMLTVDYVPPQDASDRRLKHGKYVGWRNRVA